ncbi:MAG: hypothetical protein EHM28_10250, partial [Spirochaetaceae bacterium]
ANPAGVTRIGIQEYLLTFVTAVSTADLVAGINITYNNIVDQAGLQLGAAATYNRRVSDFILATQGNEPITYVIYDNTPREPIGATYGVGYVSVFDGTGWVQYPTVALTLDGTGTAPDDLIYSINTSGNTEDIRRWYPDPTTNGVVSVFGFVSSFTTASQILGGPDYSLDFPTVGIVYESLFEFYLRFAGGIIYALLERPAASDWYRSVKPFAFGCHQPGGQKGGVTIFKNVINPTQGEVTALHYVLPRAGDVTIQVFTLAGDLVDVIYSGNQIIGEHSVTWDGRNSGGRIVARGLYFIKIVAPDIDEMRKVMVVK